MAGIDQKRCRIIAHRGGAGLRPENTLSAVAHALSLRGPDGAFIDGIEVDVLITQDGHVVVHHDFALNGSIARREGRWLGAPGPLIKDLRLAQLRLFDIGRLQPGSPVARKFPECVACDGERVALLEEVLSLCAASETLIVQVEIKRDPLRPELSVPLDEAAERIATVVRPYAHLGRVQAISFDWAVLDALKRFLPSVATGFLSGAALSADRNLGSAVRAAGSLEPAAFGGSVPAAIAAAGGTAWGPDFRHLREDAIAEAHDLGLEVNVWTVNDVQDMRRMMAMGVDAFATDYPDRALGLRDGAVE